MNTNPISQQAEPTKQNGGSALDFCLRLTRANAVVTNRLDRTLSGLHGLSFSDFMILLYLSRAPETRLRRVDLALRMELTPSGVTRSLLPLEKRGLVSRESHDRDARIAFACLTDAGAELLGYAQQSAHTIAEEATQPIRGQNFDAISSTLASLAGMNLGNS